MQLVSTNRRVTPYRVPFTFYHPKTGEAISHRLIKNRFYVHGNIYMEHVASGVEFSFQMHNHIWHKAKVALYDKSFVKDFPPSRKRFLGIAHLKLEYYEGAEEKLLSLLYSAEAYEKLSESEKVIVNDCLRRFFDSLKEYALLSIGQEDRFMNIYHQDVTSTHKGYVLLKEDVERLSFSTLLKLFFNTH